MMGWHRVILELRSPLHVGYFPLGFVQRTRYYLPARSVWGMLTAAVVRNDWNGNFNRYQEVGFEIQKEFKFTHFFIATGHGKQGGYNFFLPHYAATGEHGNDAGLRFGALFRTVFEQRFITSFGQTALAPSSQTADEASLHEKEVISNQTIPQTKNETPQQVFLCGYALCTGNNPCEKLQQLDGCQAGGDRGNGLGRIGLNPENIQPVKTGDPLWGTSAIRCTSDGILLEENAPFPCHVEVEHTDANSALCGDIEYLRWLSWHVDKGAGQSAERHPTPCWVPGSFSSAGKSVPLTAAAWGVFTIKKDQKHV